MPSGVGLEILIALGLIVVLAAAVLITRSRRASPPPPARRSRGRQSGPSQGRERPAPAPEAPVPGGGLGGRIRSLFSGGAADPWPALEDTLLRADVGPGGTRRIVDRVRARYRQGEDPAALVAEEVAALFEGDPPLDLPSGRLAIVMVVGVNGSGKTTTIGKLAALLRDAGRKVSLAGSDTFRAAAAEQLETWATRAGADLVAQQRGADPGAVAFDAVQAARARGADVLIVDTAGRLHTRVPLMEELKKVRRVLERAGGTVDETLLVVDATTGQNAVAQARAFLDAVDVTGIVLAKLDGSAKGGIVIGVREELGVPVKLVGTGEQLEDLERFDPTAFARSLVGS